VPRSEDPVLLRGEGHYSDDVSLPGQAYAVMLRSAYAHGVIRRIDIRPRVRCRRLGDLYRGGSGQGGIGPLPPRQVMNNRDGTPMLCPVRHVLATDKVRHVGRGWPRSSPNRRRREGRGRSNYRRHRPAAGRQRAGAGRCARRAADL